MIFKNPEKAQEYPVLNEYTSFLRPMKRDLIGRKGEMSEVLSAFERVEVSNVMLLGYAGSGKTALMQGVKALDKNRAYLEVNLPKMIADIRSSTNEMAEKLKELFIEVERYVQDVDEEGNKNKEVVLFIDEFHQIVQLSPAAVEVLKPCLADSATRGIRVAAATTYEEYMEYISKNKALEERFQKISLDEPPKDVVIHILSDMAEKYEVADQIVDRSLFDSIYEYTNRYIPANAQPRKSILMFDMMLGRHKYMGQALNKQTLASIIFSSTGVNVAFNVDAKTIKANLDRRVLDQTYATSEIEKTLQICVADLNDKTRPMASFLFVGSTGVGKTETVKALADILFNDSRRFIRIDMSDYGNPEDLNRLRETLTTEVWQHPYSVVLLDEVEKADKSMTRLLLPVLDDGRLTDRNGREVSFKNAYIVMTTNVGAGVFDEIAKRDNYSADEFVEEFYPLIRRQLMDESNSFPPELIGRVNAIVPFQPLKEETKEKICLKKLQEFCQEVQRKYNIVVKYHRDIVKYIILDKVETSASGGGARDVVAKIQEEIVYRVARFLNENKTELNRIQEIFVDKEGVGRWENEGSRKSTAKLVVKVLK